MTAVAHRSQPSMSTTTSSINISPPSSLLYDDEDDIPQTREHSKSQPSKSHARTRTTGTPITTTTVNTLITYSRPSASSLLATAAATIPSSAARPPLHRPSSETPSASHRWSMVEFLKSFDLSCSLRPNKPDTRTNNMGRPQSSIQLNAVIEKDKEKEKEKDRDKDKDKDKVKDKSTSKSTKQTSPRKSKTSHTSTSNPSLSSALTVSSSDLLSIDWSVSNSLSSIDDDTDEEDEKNDTESVSRQSKSSKSSTSRSSDDDGDGDLLALTTPRSRLSFSMTMSEAERTTSSLFTSSRPNYVALAVKQASPVVKPVERITVPDEMILENTPTKPSTSEISVGSSPMLPSPSSSEDGTPPNVRMSISSDASNASSSTSTPRSSMSLVTSQPSSPHHRETSITSSTSSPNITIRTSISSTMPAHHHAHIIKYSPSSRLRSSISSAGESTPRDESVTSTTTSTSTSTSTPSSSTSSSNVKLTLRPPSSPTPATGSGIKLTSLTSCAIRKNGAVIIGSSTRSSSSSFQTPVKSQIKHRSTPSLTGQCTCDNPILIPASPSLNAANIPSTPTSTSGPLQICTRCVHPALYPRYQLLHSIQDSLFGCVRLGVDQITQARVAIKISKRTLCSTGQSKSGNVVLENVRNEAAVISFLNQAPKAGVNAGIPPPAKFPTIRSQSAPTSACPHHRDVNPFTSANDIDVTPGRLSIVKLLQECEDEYYHYLATAFYTRGDLYTYLTTLPSARMNENDAKNMFYKIAMAVGYCHSKGVAHRDLSLENIMLDGDDDNIHPYVIDFGVAARKPSTSTCTCSWAFPCAPVNGKPGKLMYMSTELWCGAEWDAMKNDIWAMGVMLYCMLVGRPPFLECNDTWCQFMTSGKWYDLVMSQRKSATSDTPRKASDTNWVTLYQHLSNTALELLGQLLCKQEKRLNIQQLLQHKWFKETISTSTPSTSTPSS